MTPRASTTTKAGFTLVELLIVTAVLAIIAAIAVPYILSSRITANETAAIAVLKAISTAQTEVRGGNWIDSDSNGVGEYGYLQELSGVRATRLDTNGDGLADSDGPNVLSPPFLPVAFGGLDNRGQLARSGYLFRVYLPGRNLQWRAERALDRGYRSVSATQAESYWAVYAWPRDYGRTGKRAFFVNQVGQILACTNARTRYSGNRRPGNSAVVERGSRNRRMNGPVAVNGEGRDRNIWRVVR